MTFLKQWKAHGEEREKEARIMGEQNKKKEVAFSKSSLLGKETSASYHEL